jgi:phage replication O-like protein O
MSEKPELSDGHTRIANEIMDALARTYLSSYESQFLWCLLRKTYGWGKKEDYIAIVQIVASTGMHRSHVSRTKKKLIDRRIVTQTGNKVAFNKYYSQWRELPKQVTVTQTGSSVTQTGTFLLPKQALTKEKKETIQKKVVGGAPTPAQVCREFFTEDSVREEWTQKIMAKGINENTARSEVKKFVSYWTERNKSGTKQKWELEKTFELQRRLATWLKNFQSFSQKRYAPVS